MVIRSAIRSAVRSPLRGPLQDKWGGGNGLTVSAPSSIVFADGDQPYAMAGAEKISFSVSPTLYKGLEGAFDYYVDATNGNDANSGTSEGSAWATLLNIVGGLTSAGQTTRVLVKSGTYNDAEDYFLVDSAATGSTLEIVFEPGCVMDGTAASAIAPTNPIYAGNTGTFTCTIYGNGLIVENYDNNTAGASPNGLGWGGANVVLNAHDMVLDNCEDGVSGHDSGHANLYNVTVRNMGKQVIANIGTSSMDCYNCRFEGTGTESANFATDLNQPGLNRFYDCVFIPGANPSKNFVLNNVEMYNCQLGTLTQSFNVTLTTGIIDWYVEDTYLNIRHQAWPGQTFNRCFGFASFRVRNEAGTFTLTNNVLVGPATGLTNILYSNFDDGGGCKHVVTDNIFETATAAAFMSYDATNAGYLVAAGSEFFNNILSGSAAFDADLVSADSGGTVIVDNVTDDALIGAANTLDPDDYGYAAGSPAIGAGVSGGNCGFAVGEVAAPSPQTGRVTVTLGIDSGNLSLSQVTELTFTTGDGSADASMVFYGYVYYVLAALDGTEVDGLSSEQADISYSVLHDATGRTASKTISVTSEASYTPGMEFNVEQNSMYIPLI